MKRLSVLPFMAVLVILTVGLIGQVAEDEILLSISDPVNGSYFVVGEKPVVSVMLPAGLSKDDFSSLNLYLYGPQETNKTVTAVKLLNASTDRATRPHHYIDLITDPNVEVNENMLIYHLQAVSDEQPGTYTASLRVVSSADPLDQQMLLVDFQIGTATVETQIVDRDKCAQCHLGADNGQFYFAHVDPSSPGSVGSPALESWPVRTCKSCHNTEGYAAYRDPNDPSVRIPDPIVHRVHGVHKGAELKNPRNTDPITGIFRDYIHVEFPADIRNCTYCHVDDRWKTTPSRLACGACHDNIWFGDLASIPATAQAHRGGAQSTDAGCSFCHPANTGGYMPIAVAHKIEPPAFQHTVELSMTPSANGSYYVAGEKPQVTITIKDTNGTTIDPATIVEPTNSASVQANEWRRANLYVSGPRGNTKPVLSKAAKDNELTSYTNNDLRVRIDPTKEDPNVTRSATAITYQLDDVTGLESGTYTAFVEIMPASGMGGWAAVNFQVGTETEEPKICTNCTDCHDDTRMHAGYFAVQFDPDICKNCHDYNRAGTGYGWAGAPPTGTNGTSTSGWSGFGAKPLSSRVHGVHRGRYLQHPEDVKPLYRLVSGVPVYQPDYDFSEVIFPQDIRNCTKCHADNPVWIQEPSRLACLSCHDSDEAIYHGALMTFDLTPEDPYGGDEVETCIICHGEHAAFPPDQMHNISDPYEPPYPREPVGE